MPHLAEIWRHPIKAHGREALERIVVPTGGTLPGDRRWAVTHEASKPITGWSPCANFSRGGKAPALMAISSAWDAEAGTITLHHPERPSITFDPDADADAFIEWVVPLMPTDRAASTGIIRVENHSMTDTDYASVSLCNPASNRAVGQAVGQPLSQQRWRGNLWVDGLAPWEEFDWVGRDIQIGGARFHVHEPITRCRATMADPETGRIDANTLGALNDTWGHQHFGVYLKCIQGGEIATGDTVEVL